MDADELRAIIRPLKRAIYEVDYSWSHLEEGFEFFRKECGGLELNPDFQRGHVWKPEQQRHYIENVIRGIVATSGRLIQFNCPHWNGCKYSGDLPSGLQCVDGLQRITAVQKFLYGEILPFGMSAEELRNTEFSPFGISYRFRVAVFDYKTKADLLQHYLDLNAGGTPHSAEEIERVRKMKGETQK